MTNETAKIQAASPLVRFRDKIGSNNVKLLVVAVGITLLMSILRPQFFLSSVNFKTMAVQVTEMGLFSIAMMIVFISGGIDLSIIAVANLTSVVAGTMMMAAKEAGLGGGMIGLLIALSFVIAIVMGVILGGINGLLVSKFGMPAMLATLGTMNLYMGTAIIITKGGAFSGFPTEVTDFGNGNVLGIPIPFIILVIVVAAVAVVLNYTKYGFDLRFYGTNPKASKFSGIPNDRVIIKTYILSAVISAIAGIEMMARTNTAKADFGVSYLFVAILCAILAGTKPEGGSGSMLGMILALIILQVLSSGFNMLGMNSVLKDFIWGALLLGVMALNHFIQQREKKRAVRTERAPRKMDEAA